MKTAKKRMTKQRKRMEEVVGCLTAMQKYMDLPDPSPLLDLVGPRRAALCHALDIAQSNGDKELPQGVFDELMGCLLVLPGVLTLPDEVEFGFGFGVSGSLCHCFRACALGKPYERVLFDTKTGTVTVFEPAHREITH